MEIQLLRERLNNQAEQLNKKEINMKNWKTSLLGSLAGLPMIIEGAISKDWGKVITGVAAILLGLFAKDANVTGGTVQQ